METIPDLTNYNTKWYMHRCIKCDKGYTVGQIKKRICKCGRKHEIKASGSLDDMLALAKKRDKEG